jgi:hypothetical protein
MLCLFDKIWIIMNRFVFASIKGIKVAKRVGKNIPQLLEREDKVGKNDTESVMLVSFIS